MTFDSYIQMMLASGNVVHSVDRGLLSVVSDVTDIFGIVSAVGWVTGRNFITGERLTTAEQRAAGFNALINVASLAASMTGAGLAKKAGGSAVRYLAADIASTALGGVSGMATAGLLDYMNAPPWLQTLGGVGVGFGVGMGSNIALTDGLNVRNAGAVSDEWLARGGTDGGIDQILLSRSTATQEELFRYLRNIDENLASQFSETGRWPSNTQIPRGSHVLTPDGQIDWSQVPNDGFILDVNGNAIRNPHNLQVGDVFDRYGSPNGRFTSPVIDGTPFNYDSRSLPFIEDIRMYRQYEVIGDFSNLRSVINNADPEIRSVVNAYLNRWNIPDSALNIQAGRIASGFNSTGGGIQWQFPLPIDMLEDLNLIREIR